MQFHAKPIGEFRGGANYYDGGHSKRDMQSRNLTVLASRVRAWNFLPRSPP